MAHVEFLELRPIRPPRRMITGFSIDAPVTGSRDRGSSVHFKGWVLGNERRVVAVELSGPGGFVQRIPLGYWRADIADGHPAIPNAERCGFRGFVDLTGVGPIFELVLSAVFEDDTALPIARFTGRWATTRGEVAPEPPAPTTSEPTELPAPPAERPLVSVVIPVHNQSRLTRDCLDTLLAPGNIAVPHEIIVVDDGSTDDTADVLAAYAPRVRAAHLSPNAGFGGACNTGASLAAGDFIVFLNNDTIPLPGWLDALVAHSENHPSAAIVGSKLLYPDGSVQHAGVSFAQNGYPHHLYAGFPADHPAVNVSRRFKAVTAACMLVRAPVFRAASGFDRVFVNGWEDTDLCLRLDAQGHEIHYCHESVVYHLESASRDSESPREIQNRAIWTERWIGKVEPDFLDYWSADGLLRMEVIGPLYPMRIRYAPEVAVVQELRPEPALPPPRLHSRLRPRSRRPDRNGRVHGRLRRHRSAAGSPERGAVLDKDAPALSR